MIINPVLATAAIDDVIAGGATEALTCRRQITAVQDIIVIGADDPLNTFEGIGANFGDIVCIGAGGRSRL